MLDTKRRLSPGECATVLSLSFFRSALGRQDVTEIASRERDVGVLRPEHLLAQGDNVPVLPFGPSVIALRVESHGEVVSDEQRVRVLWTELIFPLGSPGGREAVSLDGITGSRAPASLAGGLLSPKAIS